MGNKVHKITLGTMQEGLYNDADFQSLTPMELVSKTVPELRTIIQERRERREEERAQMVERLAQVWPAPSPLSISVLDTWFLSLPGVLVFFHWNGRWGGGLGMTNLLLM